MLFLHFIFYGIIAIFLQIFLLREFVPILHGNEFSIGIILSNWLFGMALGSYIFSYVKQPKNVKKTVTVMLCFLFVVIIASFIFIRSINLMTNTDIIMQGISLKTALFVSFIAIAPVSFIMGTIVSLMIPFMKDKGYKHPGELIYMYEAAGFVAGGMVFSFFMSNLSASIVLKIIAGLLCINFIFLLNKRVLKLLFILLFTFILYLMQNFSQYIEKSTILNNYKDTKIIDISYNNNTQYVLTQKHGEIAFYSNGVMLFGLPNPNIFEDEDFAHLPMLHHKNPKKVLIIGGAVKYLPAITKYGVEQIDYIENDAVVTDTVKKNISKFSSVFDDERLNIYNADGREFLKNNDNVYDVILIGLSAPINTSINKFYTEDFFKIVSHRLAGDGFFALKLSGSMVYSAPLMSELNSSVFNSLKNIFEFVQIIPGKQNILIASKSPMPFRLHIKARLRNIEDETFVLSKYYVDERMDTQKTSWLKFQMNKKRNLALTNTDANPKAMIFSIMHWQSAFSPFLMKFFRVLMEYSYIFVLVAVILFFSFKLKYRVTAFSSGASAMWLQMVCFWAFQIYGGNIYKWFGLLTAIFMAGVVLGVFYSRKKHRGVALNKTFFISQLIYLIWIALWFVIVKFQLIDMSSLFAFSFGTGILTGLEFAQILKIFVIMKENISKVKIYSADLLGGWFASGLGGAFLIPIWGVERFLLFILFLRFLIFAWWEHGRKKGL